MTRPARLIPGDILLAAALGVSLLLFPRVGHAKEDPRPPAQARTMTAVELLTLYGDKSWQWPDGAGFMETRDRRFTAISGSGEQAGWAEGRWSVSDKGRLCFVADWHTKSGVSPGRTCFVHMVDEETIYQRREPSGEWYVFKHAKPAAGDEFRKLVREDLVSAKLERRKLNARSMNKP
jgi:hypothetical protein